MFKVEKPQDKGNRRKELQAKVSLLFSALLTRIKDEDYRREVLNELVDLEMAEEEVKKKSLPGHGMGLGVTEMYRLFDSRKCPEDFVEFAAHAEKHIPEAEFEDFTIAFKNFIFGLPIKKREEMAEKRKGKVLEEYFINYLVGKL